MKRPLARRSWTLVLASLLFTQANAVRASLTAADNKEQSFGSNSQQLTSRQNDEGGRKTGKKHRDTDNPALSATFSEDVASTIIERLARGFEDHDEPLTLSAFDSQRMAGFLNFQSQIHALFQSYEVFRVHFRIAQVTAEDKKGIVLVDFEFEESAGSGDLQPVRKQEQLHFEMERGKRDWKIVDLKPRPFFS